MSSLTSAGISAASLDDFTWKSIKLPSILPMAAVAQVSFSLISTRALVTDEDTALTGLSNPQQAAGHWKNPEDGHPPWMTMNTPENRPFLCPNSHSV